METVNGLRVGPLLRFVDIRRATIWVETERPCEVEVLGHSAPTFEIEGHHYALVVVGGLEPGSAYPYEVRLDGQPVWPGADSKLPPSIIRTLSEDGSLRVTFGSCRVSGPRKVPLGLDRILRRYDPDLDALTALARRLARTDPSGWPDLLLLLGDQVYADDIPETTRQAIQARRGAADPIGSSVADFEEYCHLYRDSWTEPLIRWLYSTVPSAMIFDDHELVDNWDISESWVEEMRATEGWDARLTGAVMSYWLYQHIGNLSPEELDQDRLYQEVLADRDGDRLRQFIREVDRNHEGSRWAYRRDFGDVRLLVLDSRATRVLEDGKRDMLDPAEWRWLEDNLASSRHLLVATSVPVFYALGFHQLQAWSERVAGGAWGATAARLTERLRRTLSLSGWPSFGASFEHLVGLLGELGSGRRGEPPESITILSGDVHHGYVARVEWPASMGVRSTVHQVVSSPFRNPLMPHERLMQRLAATRLGGRLLGLLAVAARVPSPGVRWQRLEGLDFANQVATLRIDAEGLELHAERASHVRRQPIGLATLWRTRLVGPGHHPGRSGGATKEGDPPETHT